MGRRGDLVCCGGANVVHLGPGQAQNRGHGAFALRHGLLHELATGADGADGIGEAERAGGDVGAVLAQGVARGEGRCKARNLLGQHAKCRDGDGQDGWLGVLGQLEGFGGAFKDDLGQRKAQGFIRFIEDCACGGEFLVEFAAHPDGLGTLAWEEKRWLISHWHRSDGKRTGAPGGTQA
jgi:hypothetical protein